MSMNYEPSTLSSSFSPKLLKKKAQSKRVNTKSKNNKKFQIPPLTPPSKLLKRSSCSLIKKEIGFYTITDHPLGTSNGNVFLGFNTLQYTKVAVKVIKLLVHINDIHHIENEVKLLDKMKYSTRVVKLLNYFVDEWSNGYLIFELADMNLMEYYWKEAGCVGDESLKKDGVVTGFLTKEENVVKVFRQVVKAVGDLHANKIAHRDLKMENLFVFLKDGEKGGIRVKVGDLGLSTECERGEKLTMFCGSPLYSAPEVNQGIPYCGYKYDVWSLGIILYFLLYGNFPFNVYKHEVAKESEDEDDIRRNIITNLFKKIQNEPLAFDGKKPISESNKMLLKLLLTKEPEERPYIEDVLQHPALQK